MAVLLSTVFMGTYSEQSRSEISADQKTTADEKEHYFRDLNDRYSYAYGADLAEKFKAEGVELNVAVMSVAMQAVFDGGEKKMSAGEIAATIDIYMEIHEKKKEAERIAAGKKNKEKSDIFLSENANKQGVVVTNSGLQYKVITEGGGGYTPTENDIVTVHYRATFVDGTEFDNTYTRDEPYSIKVEKLIESWGEALQLMSKDSRWELYIPADLAYGEEGSEPYVGPSAALIFEVELLEVESAEG